MANTVQVLQCHFTTITLLSFKQNVFSLWEFYGKHLPQKCVVHFSHFLLTPNLTPLICEIVSLNHLPQCHSVHLHTLFFQYTTVETQCT